MSDRYRMSQDVRQAAQELVWKACDVIELLVNDVRGCGRDDASHGARQSRKGVLRPSSEKAQPEVAQRAEALLRKKGFENGGIK